MEPWYRFAVMIIRPFLAVFFKTDFKGQENVPKQGGFIVAVNHISNVDPFAVALYLHVLKRRPRFLAKSSLFKLPLAGSVLRGAKQIPVYRDTADAGKALSAAVESLRNGQAVVVYPESTVTRDPDLWPMSAKTGVARLALMSGAPVIPIGQWGAHEFLPYTTNKPHPLPRKTLRITAGPPVDLSEFAGADLTSDVLRAATTKIMGDVTALVAGIRGGTPPETPYAFRSDERRTA